MSLVKIDLSRNPICDEGASLIRSLATLPSLKELRMQECHISDAGLPQEAIESSQSFTSLEALDLSQNESLTEAAVRAKLFSERKLHVVQDIDMTANHDTSKDSNSFVPIRLAVGKIIHKGLWEIEVEKQEPKKEPAPSTATVTVGSTPKPVPHPIVKKEQWELDAEAGLNTAGGRRRAEAKLGAQESDAATQGTPSTSSNPVLSLDKYYTSSHATLSLPPALPIPKGRLAHNRSQSIHSSQVGSGGYDPAVPLQTVPLSLILEHPWSATLRVLGLSNRRADVRIVQPLLDSVHSNMLPRLEELKLDGCNLSDTIRIGDEHSSVSLSVSTSLPPGKKGDTLTESTIRALMRLFPNLKVLDVSFNNLTTLDGVEEMFLPPLASSEGNGSGLRGGLRVLRARSNQIDDKGLVPLIALCQKFRQTRCEQWKGEEIDMRENSIAKVVFQPRSRAFMVH